MNIFALFAEWEYDLSRDAVVLLIVSIYLYTKSLQLNKNFCTLVIGLSVLEKY